MTDPGYGQPRPDYGAAPTQAAGYPAQGAGFPGQGSGYPGQGAGYPGQGSGFQGQGAGHQSQAAGYGAPAQNGMSAQGFVSSLFDFGFTSFVTPKVVKVVYVLIMALLGLSTLGLVIFGFSFGALFGLLALIIFAPLYFFIYLALWRIALEIFVVIFRIADDLQAIRRSGLR